MKRLSIILGIALILVAAATTGFAAETARDSKEEAPLRNTDAKKVENEDSGKENRGSLDTTPSSWSNVKALWG